MAVNTGILLSVRAKATRLPGKVFKPLGSGTNVTQFLLRRLKTSRRSGSLIVATSQDPRDAVLCDVARAEGVKCFRGNAEDKLRRYRDAGLEHGLDFVVVVDGDDPFVSTTHIDRIFEFAEHNHGDLVVFSNLPLGATGFGIRRSALERICDRHPECNTEVWGSMFRSDPSFVCIDLEENDPILARPDIRMTLDYPDDYAFFTAVVGERKADDVTFEWVMKFLADRPDVISINRNLQTVYEDHLKKSQPKSSSIP